MMLWLLGAAFVLYVVLIYVTRRIAQSRREYVATVLAEIVDQWRLGHLFYQWVFVLQWRKIQPRVYIPAKQLRRIVLLMRAFPLRRVAKEYIRIRMIVERECPMLTCRGFEEFQDFNKTGTVKKLLREILLIFPRIEKCRQRYMSAFSKKRSIIGSLDSERQRKTACEMSVILKVLSSLERVEQRLTLLYLRDLHPIHVSLKRHNADSKEVQFSKTQRLEKLAIVWASIHNKITLKQFSFTIRCLDRQPVCEKECDGLGLSETNESVVIEVKTSWDAVSMSMNKANSLDVQLKVATEHGFGRSLGIIVGEKNPSWLEYSGQRYLCSSLTTYLASNVDSCGYVSQLRDIITDTRQSSILAGRKVNQIRASNQIQIVSLSTLDHLGETILGMYGREDVTYPTDTLQHQIQLYCHVLFTLPPSTWGY